jgi:hypothetical protein
MMATVQAQDAVQPVAPKTRSPWLVPVMIAAFAVAVMSAGALIAVVVTDDDEPQPQRVQVPVPVAVDIAAAKAIKDESKAAAAVSGTPATVASPAAGRSTLESATPIPEAKTDAAIHALGVRSQALQDQLERGFGAARDNIAARAGTPADGDAAVAAGTVARALAQERYYSSQGASSEGLAAKDEAATAAAIGNP